MEIDIDMSQNDLNTKFIKIIFYEFYSDEI
jgi:hypothetical protein